MDIPQAAISFLTGYVQIYGLLAVFIFMALESALIPIPSEITMPFAGFLASRNLLNFWEVVFVGALANLVGSLIAYYLGYFKGEAWTIKFIKRWGHLILIKEDEFVRAKKWLNNFGLQVAFFSRLMPVVRTYISLPSGISKVNVYKFSIFTFLGSLIWSYVLTFLGLKLGENWASIEPYFRSFQIIIVVSFIVLIGLFIWRKSRK